MDKKPYMILTASPKGGVGKTLISINVAAALRSSGYEVLLIDTDVENPSVGPLLGSGLGGLGYAEAVKGESKIDDMLVLYPSCGFYYLPAGGSEDDERPKPEEVIKFYSLASKSKFDFVIIDSPPGSDTVSALKLFDEALIVTTPEETSVLGAQRLSKLYTKNHLGHKLVINRIKDGKFQLGEDTIEKLYGDIAYAMVPEDRIIDESEIKHMPAYLLNRTSLFSIAIDSLCRSYMLKAGEPAMPQQSKKSSGFEIKKFFGMR